MNKNAIRVSRTQRQCAIILLMLLAGLCATAGRLSAAGAQPGLLGIVYGDQAMKRVAEKFPVPRLDERIPEWPTQRDGGLRLLGSLTSPVSGRLTLHLETTQRARLWLGGHKLLEVGSEGGTIEVDFRAGVPQAIVLEYMQAVPPSLLRLTWRLPGGKFEPVPESALSHDQSDVAAVEAAGARPARETLLVVANPDPARLATLSVWRTPQTLMVGATIPSLPGFTCDSWCYEGGMEFVACRDLGAGRLELRHRLTATPEVLVVTVVTPEAGAAEFLAHLEREDGADGPLPGTPALPNLCWQVKASPAFASNPDPYPDFFARCFIFTEKGRVFLDRTGRRKIPARGADIMENNPPWVQIYGPAWEPPQRSKPGAWADYSPDRFACSVIGVVSRDGKHLAAIATDTAGSLCQAWHDCMHINSDWASADRRTWRQKIYVMENDPEKLLETAAQDFPGIRRQLMSSRAASKSAGLH